MKIPMANSIARLPLWQVDAMAAAVICLGAGVWYFAGLSPLVEARATRQNLETELAGEKDALQKQSALIKRREQMLEEAKAQILASRVQLLPPDQINQQVAKLTEMASGIGLSIDEIKPLGPAPQERFTTVPIKVSGVGSYEAVTKFMERLRSDFHDTGVSGFALGGSPEKPDEILKFELNLVWYAAPLQGAVQKKAP